MGKPILHYFELRGRGEPIRLALAYAQAAGKIEGWEFKPVDYAGMKVGCFVEVTGLKPGDQMSNAAASPICCPAGRQRDLPFWTGKVCAEWELPLPC
jgi:hypothetical protein